MVSIAHATHCVLPDVCCRINNIQSVCGTGVMQRRSRSPNSNITGGTSVIDMLLLLMHAGCLLYRILCRNAPNVCSNSALGSNFILYVCTTHIAMQTIPYNRKRFVD